MGPHNSQGSPCGNQHHRQKRGPPAGNNNIKKHSSAMAAMEVQVTTLAGECWTFQADNWTLRDLKARENPNFAVKEAAWCRKIW